MCYDVPLYVLSLVTHVVPFHCMSYVTWQWKNTCFGIQNTHKTCLEYRTEYKTVYRIHTELNTELYTEYTLNTELYSRHVLCVTRVLNTLLYSSCVTQSHQTGFEYITHTQYECGIQNTHKTSLEYRTHHVWSHVPRHNYRSLLQKSPIKEAIFCKRDPTHTTRILNTEDNVLYIPVSSCVTSWRKLHKMRYLCRSISAKEPYK